MWDTLRCATHPSQLRAGESPQALPRAWPLSVARQFPMRDTVGIRRRLAQARHLVLLVGLEVALEPVPVVGLILRALPCQDVGRHPVQEPAIVRDDDGAARERK